MTMESEVIIIGAGPAGIATSACLNRGDVSNIVLEREDCCVSLWRKRAYDRLKLHLAKKYCELPYMSFPEEAPTYVPKSDFVSYMDNYVEKFHVSPKYHREVESAYFDTTISKWSVVVRDLISDAYEAYFSRFLVVATGENCQGFIPHLNGIEGFEGKIIHSSQYKNGESFVEKNVLVVGCGNSGMEIAFDLCNWNVNTSLVARGPVHLLTEDIVKLGMFLLKFLPIKLVDTIAQTLGILKHGNVAKYGFQTPKKGPFTLKATIGKSPTIDIGTIKKIKSGEIKVFPSISRIEGNNVKFNNGETHCFDAIVFATGYKSTVKTWLKDGDDMFNDKGMPRKRLPNDYWKGQKGLYCAGFSSRGLFGISQDAQNIAKDIILNLTASKKLSK